MTLKDFLEVCNKKDYIGIWNISGNPLKEHKSRSRFEEQPTQQSYFKIENLPYGRIQYFLDYDVYCINHTEKGYLVRIGKKQEIHENYLMGQLAYKIAQDIKREGLLR